MSLSIPEIVIIVVAVPILIFEVSMFVDMLQNEYLSQKDKTIWAVAMLLLHPFVAIYYYFTARRNK